MGKIGNCQVAVSVHAAGDKASAPLYWRLFMPLSWDDAAADSPDAAAAVTARRQACKIPAGEHHRPNWQMAIEMLDELAQWGYRTPVVAADAGYGDTTAFRLALTERATSATSLRPRAPPAPTPLTPGLSRPRTPAGGAPRPGLPRRPAQL